MKLYPNYWRDVREICIPIWKAGAYWAMAYSDILTMYAKQIVNLIP